MASRRKFKKEIKSKTNSLIEDAFIESVNGDKKEEEKMDKLIDELIDERYEMLNKVSDYPINGNRSEVKAHFNQIKKDLDTKTSTYSKKIGRVS